MTDVRTAPSPTLREEHSAQRGDFIWYELMTPDAEGAKKFYDRLRRLERRRGRSRIQRLSDDRPKRRQICRRDHAAHKRNAATWRQADLARLSQRERRRRSGGERRTSRRKGADGCVRHSKCRTHCAGARPARSAILPHEADPAGRRSQRDAVMSFHQASSNVSAGTSCRRRTSRQPVASMEASSAGRAMNSCRWAKWASIASSTTDGTTHRSRFQGAERPASRIGASISACPRSRQRSRRRKRTAATIHMGPHQVPTGDWVIVGSDPQGAEFALVGGE